jgi:hypothetical protein
MTGGVEEYGGQRGALWPVAPAAEPAGKGEVDGSAVDCGAHRTDIDNLLHRRVGARCAEQRLAGQRVRRRERRLMRPFEGRIAKHARSAPQHPPTGDCGLGGPVLGAAMQFSVAIDQEILCRSGVRACQLGQGRSEAEYRSQTKSMDICEHNVRHHLIRFVL